MPDAPVRSVYRLRINPVELAHASGEIARRRFNHQMIVIGHQAIRMTNPVEPRANLPQQRQPSLAVDIGKINVLAPIATGRDVM
jgi:hypothetical protein